MCSETELANVSEVGNPAQKRSEQDKKRDHVVTRKVLGGGSSSGGANKLCFVKQSHEWTELENTVAMRRIEGGVKFNRLKEIPLPIREHMALSLTKAYVQLWDNLKKSGHDFSRETLTDLLSWHASFEHLGTYGFKDDMLPSIEKLIGVVEEILKSDERARKREELVVEIGEMEELGKKKMKLGELDSGAIDGQVVKLKEDYKRVLDLIR